ncbi:MAG TPA: hypothetical protein VEX11_16225 [Acetobacteraceae bacterium]|nr:hypothetical protein [Acetobacteraceae bacterium]
MKQVEQGPHGSCRPAFPTAAKALPLIDAFEDVPPKRRTRMKAAIALLSRVYGRPLEAIPLDPADLGRRFPSASAFACGVKASTLYSYRSDIRMVLWRLGVTDRPGRRADPLPPDWAELRRDLPDKYLSIWLQRFMGFCADAGIPPDGAGGDAALAAYLDHLTVRQLTRDPLGKVQRVARAWNRAVDTVPGWPAARLLAPVVRNHTYSFPFSQYPASFQADVEEFRRQLACGGSFGSGDDGGGGDDGPGMTAFLGEPASPDTVEIRSWNIRFAAAALVHSGTPIEQITGLAVLVEPRNLRAIIDWHWRRAGKRKSHQVGNIAETLRIVAKRHVCLSGPALAEVLALAKKAQPRQQRRMTPKNERRLLQLEDPSLEAQLLHLPKPLLAEARALLKAGPGHRHEAAWLAGVAVAVEIELHCPMRLKNLASLRIGHELVRLDGRGKGWTHLMVEAEDVKNEVSPLVCTIRPESSRVIEAYLRDFRPVLEHSGTVWLFPGRDCADRPRSRSNFGSAISDAIRRFVGIEMNTHLFRAFAGAQILMDNPGALEDLRLVLGHTTLRTALQYYASRSAKRAAENLGRLVSRRREETRLVAAAAFHKFQPRKPRRAA